MGRPTPFISVLGAAALVALPLAGCGKPKQQGGGPGMSGPAVVRYVVAKTQSVPLTTELSGRTSPYLVAEVRPQVGGIVKSRLFVEGAEVKAGQALYQIDPATYQAGASSARAALAQAQATLTAAKLKADRYKELVAIDAVSKQDNDDAQAAYQQAAANVAVQKAAVDQAQINLGYSKVSAPISGRIGKSTVTPGALVSASQDAALTTVQQLDPIYVDVNQSTVQLLKLRRDIASGQVAGTAISAPVTLILEDGSTYPLTGKLAFSDVAVDTTTGSVALRAVFANPNGVLLPGMYVRANVGQGARSGVLTPQGAVGRTPRGEATVFVVGAGDKAELRTVKADQTVGDKWLVTEGLKDGDKVIVEGLQSVHPGGPLKPSPLGAPVQMAAPPAAQR
jgi:membrane fusion protein, multidrug efflux system